MSYLMIFNAFSHSFYLLVQVRMLLGMAYPEYSDISMGSNWYLKWQSEAGTNFRNRNTEEFRWYFWFLVRAAIYGYIMFHVFWYLKRKAPRVLGFGPLRRDPNFRKLRRVVKFCPVNYDEVKCLLLLILF